jgi:hypothetical protein
MSTRAFPITESNGAIKMTIYGAEREGDTLTLDIGAIDGYRGFIEIVGEDGVAYRQDSSYGALDGPGWGTARYVARFEIPSDVKIDRVDFTPEEPTGGSAFSIYWGSDASLKIDDVVIQVTNVVEVEYMPGYKVVDITIHVKNNGDSAVELSKEDVEFMDHFGWIYDRNNVVNDDPLVVVPANSDKKFHLKFSHVLLASKHTTLRYKDESISLIGVD